MSIKVVPIAHITSKSENLNKKIVFRLKSAIFIIGIHECCLGTVKLGTKAFFDTSLYISGMRSDWGPPLNIHISRMNPLGR